MLVKFKFFTCGGEQKYLAYSLVHILNVLVKNGKNLLGKLLSTSFQHARLVFKFDGVLLLNSNPISY